jgi:hypothetical protein
MPDKFNAAAQGRLNAMKGLYNAALVGMSNVQGDDVQGYLSMTVGNLGVVKIAGKLSDGTVVSGSAKLLEGLNADGWLCVALYKPLYTKKGFVGGLLWLNPQDRVIRVDTVYGWFVDWVCEDPKKGAFEKELSVVGGAFMGQPGSLSYFGANVPESLPAPVANLPDGAWVEAAFPWELPVTASGTKLTLPKATAPKKVGNGTDAYYDYATANPSGATLMYTAKTGLFRGAFKLYYDGFDAKGALQLKSIRVPYTGVMVPQDGGGLTGLGFGIATVNKQKVGIPVYLRE